MRKIALFSATVLALFLASFWTVKAINHAWQNFVIVPFEADFVQTQYPPERSSPGSPFTAPRSQKYTRAQRSDGSIAVVGESTQNITDLQKKLNIQVNRTTESIQTRGLFPSVVQDIKHRAVLCRDFEKSDVKFMGYSTVIERQEASGERMTRIFVPDLNCLEIRNEYWHYFDRGGWVSATREAVALRLGEPDPKYFTTPDWPELGPIQTNEEYQRRTGKPGLRPEDASRLQRQYESKRPVVK